MKHVSHRRRTVVLLVFIALLVASLSVSIGSALGASSSPSPAASDSGKVVYKVGWTRGVDSLNPFIGYVAPSYEVWYLTYETLIGWRANDLAVTKGADSTGLATDWTTSPDGLTWTFTIRKDAKWSDGVALTAKDVAFTYNYIIDNDMSNLTSYTNLINHATALDDYTVQFVCSKPKPDMLRHWVPILPEHIWSKISPKDAAKGFQNLPPIVGSGPFQCVEWKKSSYVKMVQNPYWRGPKPKIDEIYFMDFTNEDTMVQDVKSGNIDACVNLTPTQLQQFKGNPDVMARAIAVDGFNELGMNCYDSPDSKGNPVLRDANFRVALNYAVDLKKIVNVVWLDYTTPGTTIIPPNYYKNPDWHWEPPADVKYTYNPDMAMQKLDAAGYRDTNGDGIREDKGKPIELSLIARSESVQSQQEAKLIAGWLRKVGLKITLEVMDEGALMGRQYETTNGKFTPNYDLFMWGWYLDYDPNSMLSYFTKSQINNWSDCNWTDPEYEQLWKQQSEELDPAKRKPIIDRMQQILYEQSPYIVTEYAPDFEAYRTDRWQGYMQIPDPNGNTILPPFGNGVGYANFLSIEPKTAEAGAGGSSSTTLIVVIVIAVVVVAGIVWMVMRSRSKSHVMEE